MRQRMSGGKREGGGGDTEPEPEMNSATALRTRTEYAGHHQVAALRLRTGHQALQTCIKRQKVTVNSLGLDGDTKCQQMQVTQTSTMRLKGAIHHRRRKRASYVAGHCYGLLCNDTDTSNVSPLSCLQRQRSETQGSQLCVLWH